MSALPGILQRISEVAGQAAALKLARERGGCEIKVSGKPGGALARIVGDEAAAAIAAEFGPEKITVPMAHLRGQRGRREAAARLFAEDKTESQVALAVDVHCRTARRVRRKVRQSKLPLFE